MAKDSAALIPNTIPAHLRKSGPARPSKQPSPAGKRPSWLKVRLSVNHNFRDLRKLVHESGLHTVCESAACPNIGECWANKALTFMILGNICTRSCGFCDVRTGKPGSVDIDEPDRVAKALAHIGLNYAVVTSVDRDDLVDGGAYAWAQTIRKIKKACPDMKLEVLTPDFKGDHDCIATVVEAGPDVFAHNIETSDRMHKLVRPQAKYLRSLDVLRHARDLGAVTKSGIMVGLGETDDEVLETLQDLADHGVEIVSIGQYMRPSDNHLPVERWVHPDSFELFRVEGMKMGFAHVESGPLVRSSYRADTQAKAAQAQRQAQAAAEEGA